MVHFVSNILIPKRSNFESKIWRNVFLYFFNCLYWSYTYISKEFIESERGNQKLNIKLGGYCPAPVPLVVSTSWPFPFSWIITRFVTRETRWVPLVGRNLTLPEHLHLSLVESGVRVAWSSVFCVVFCTCRSLFVVLFSFIWPLFCLFFSDLRILITPLVSSNSSYAMCNLAKM